MKFERIEPIVKIENNIYVRHKISALLDGELIQKCDICGEVINDYTPPKNGFSIKWKHDKDGKWIEDTDKKVYGMMEGYIFKQKGSQSDCIMHETFGTPEEFIDCTAINS